MRQFIFLLSFATATIFISSCAASHKTKDEAGLVGTKFHDLTARYNGYFNAKELYKESKLLLEESHQDNFNRILSIYPFEAVEDPNSVEADMDKAIEKVTKVSSIHHISKWVDDCYVLMGKAQYLKGDYESAQETFEYFIDDFNPKDPDSRVYETPDRREDAKARKKEQERERKIKQEEREKAQKEKEKERDRIKKERKKSRNKKDKKRTKKTDAEKQAEIAAKENKERGNKIEGIASSSDEIPINEDEAYLASIEKSKAENKKKADNPFEGGFLKHRPSYYEGMLWLSKSYIKREKWLDAKYYLDRIEEEGFASKEVLNEVPVVRADMLLKMKDYNAAQKALLLAIEKSSDKRKNARLTFILAQLYQMKGDAEKASATFEQVDDYKASFEMQLHAQMNQLKNAWAANTLMSKEAIKKLNKLAKDSKNEPYKGSIYFTQAEILLADGDETEALEHFNKALQHSNSTNKTEIYYRLASLFLSRERYVDSKNYFDSTLTIMNKKDERFSTVKRFANNLSSIANNIILIDTKDSLLRLAALSPEEQRKIAEATAQREAEKKRESQQEALNINTTTTILSGNSKFFAYNPSSIQKGRQDFVKRWGTRVLEDDWRRSNKTSSIIDQEEEGAIIEEELKEDLTVEIEKLLRGIPNSPAEKNNANEILEKAYFELGTGYRTYIENFEKSNKTLKSLISKYPQTEYRVEAYYFIYLNYLDLDEQGNAQEYYNKILAEFPQSAFALYLKDPTNKNALLTPEKQIEIYYENTYREFENGNYKLVFDRLEKAREEYGQEHHMIPKYDLLRAMSIGNISGQNEYINALRGVILKHNNTPEQTYAKEMLRFLRGDEEAFDEGDNQSDLSEFKIENDKLHYIIVLLYNGNGNDVNNIKKDLNAYNESKFSDWRLRSTSMYLNQEKKVHLILLRRFADREQAMEYYNQYQANPDEFLDPDKYSYDVFAINQLNYRQVITKKSANSYRRFFEKEYLK